MKKSFDELAEEIYGPEDADNRDRSNVDDIDRQARQLEADTDNELPQADVSPPLEAVTQPGGDAKDILGDNASPTTSSNKEALKNDPVTKSQSDGKPSTEDPEQVVDPWIADVIEASVYVDAAEKSVQTYAEIVAAAKADLKSAELEYTKCIATLREAIKDSGKGQGLLPFSDPVATSSQPPRAIDESWRDISLYDIPNMPSLGLVAMTGAGLCTISDLADWEVKGHNLRDIKGIGDKVAESIELAMVNFWVNRKGIKTKVEVTADCENMESVDR